MPAVALLCDLAKCRAENLNLVACSAGPGSFTALRIGMATAKGIARGAQCAFKAVPTLELLAAGREHWPGIVVPVMDARKKRVYIAAFRNGQRISPDLDTDLASFLKKFPKESNILLTGADAKIIAKDLEGVTLDPLYNSPRGRYMLDMALDSLQKYGSDPLDSGPLYLRLSEAEENLKFQ